MRGCPASHYGHVQPYTADSRQTNILLFYGFRVGGGYVELLLREP